MRIVAQRVKNAEVNIKGECVGQIKHGLLLLVGISNADSELDVHYLVQKIAGLRIFADHAGKMNLSVLDIGGSVLSVSQFTLYGDCSRGRRPSFATAAKSDQALQLYRLFNQSLLSHGITLQTGVFGAEMDIHLTNWGPVTIILDSKQQHSGA